MGTTAVGPITLPGSDAGQWAGFFIAVVASVAIAKHLPYVKKFV